MMGLDLSHTDFSWSYSAINDWRIELCRAANIETDEDFSYFIMDTDDVLYELLDHSDCEGEIGRDKCLLLADRLEGLIDKMEKRKNISIEFIAALREAYNSGDNLEFI